MKKLLILLSILVFVVILIYSCNKNGNANSIENLGQSLHLKSPDGKVLASSIEDLKLQINSQIFRKFNSNTISYSVTNISYATTKSGGMIANVSYLTKNGISSNILILDGVKEKVNALGNVNVVIEDKYSASTLRNEATMSVRAMNLPSKHTYSCSGPSCCTVHAVEHTDGTIDIDCSCSGCSMTVD